MDRVTRHQIKHDKFVEDVGTAYSFMRSHSRGVWLGVGALALLIVGVAAWLIVQEKSETQGQARLSEAIDIMNAPVESGFSETTPSTELKFKSEQEKVTKAQPIFEEVATKYKGTDAADIAGLYLARFAAERGDIAAARPMLETFLREHPDHILGGAAKRSLYEIRIAAGEGQQVIPELEKELADPDNALPHDVVLALLAQSYEFAGNTTKAKEAYQRIVNEFPDSPYTMDAQRKLFQG
jgi:tetratricopeptide (TPR) repeat protein